MALPDCPIFCAKFLLFLRRFLKFQCCEGSPKILAPDSISRQNFRHNSRSGSRFQTGSIFVPARKVARQYQNELSGSFASRQGRLLFPTPSLRPLSGRVAHHSERLPCSLLLRPTHSANSPTPTPHKPMKSSRAAKRPRCAPVDDGSRAVAEVAVAYPLSELVQRAPHGAGGR
jgi:hypothetical protein